MWRLAKQQLCTCITLFGTFLCLHCTTTTWKCLISRFAENVNTRQHLHLSFPELRYSLLELNSPKKIAYIWRTERDGISAIKFEEARLRSCRRRCCWSSLISLKTWQGRILGEGAGGAHPPSPPWDDLRFSNTTGILQKKKNSVVYWCWSGARDECTPS